MVRWVDHVSTAIVTGLTVLALLAGASAPAQVQSARAKVDLVLVNKEARTLTLYSGRAPLKTYRIALGRNPKGHKQEEGDSRTPEGRYVIDSRNASSKFHRALHISYPNEEDRRRAKARGVKPGGDIMIHGLPNGMRAVGKAHRLRDWTDGCIAVTNEEIEEIWRMVPDGTRIEIRR